MIAQLENLYYKPGEPSAYAGAYHLLKDVKARTLLSEDEIRDWLDAQDAYNLHKMSRKRFHRRSYNTSNVDDLWEVDVAFFGKDFSECNDGYSYILVAIDVLSKYAFAEPLQNKQSDTVAEAFESILDRSKRWPVMVQSDRGTEFTGKAMQNMLNKHNILYRKVRDPVNKASVAERFIRTLKGRIWRYFTHKDTHRFIDVLQPIVHSYNNTVHSAIKMTPSSVDIFNARTVRENLEKRYAHRDRIGKPLDASKRRAKYKVNNLVRISSERGRFSKGYERGYTIEIFKIAGKSTATYPHVYFLKDLKGEDIDGIFYEQELTRVNKKIREIVFEIDEVLKSKGQGRS